MVDPPEGERSEVDCRSWLNYDTYRNVNEATSQGPSEIRSQPASRTAAKPGGEEGHPARRARAPRGGRPWRGDHGRRGRPGGRGEAHGLPMVARSARCGHGGPDGGGGGRTRAEHSDLRDPGAPAP